MITLSYSYCQANSDILRNAVCLCRKVGFVVIYRVGYQQKLKKIIWAGSFACPRCNASKDHHLYEVKSICSLFFIPIISVTTKRILACDCCQNGRKISRKEYNELHTQANKRLKHEEFPTSIILSDFSPRELHFGLKIFGLILAIAFSLTMLVGIIGMLFDVGLSDSSTYFGGLFMLALGVLPLVAAIRSVSSAKRKRKLYRAVKTS